MIGDGIMIGEDDDTIDLSKFLEEFTKEYNKKKLRENRFKKLQKLNEIIEE